MEKPRSFAELLEKETVQLAEVLEKRGEQPRMVEFKVGVGGRWGAIGKLVDKVFSPRVVVRDFRPQDFIPPEDDFTNVSEVLMGRFFLKGNEPSRLRLLSDWSLLGLREEGKNVLGETQRVIGQEISARRESRRVETVGDFRLYTVNLGTEATKK